MSSDATHTDPHEAKPAPGTDHKTRAKDAPIVRESQKAPNMISSIFWFLFVAFLVILMARSCRSEKKTASTSAPIAQSQPAVVPEKHTTIIEARTFNVPPSCLKIYLVQGWKAYNLSAEPVEMRNHLGQVLGVLKPGAKIRRGYDPDGMKMFCPIDPGDTHREIEIYADWRP